MEIATNNQTQTNKQTASPTHFSTKDADRLKAREWEKILWANGNDKKAEAEIFISEKNRL